MTLTFDLTHDLDLRFFQVKFWISCIPGIVGLIDVKWKGNKSIGYWTKYVTFPFNHTYDLGLGFSRSTFEITLSHVSEGWLIWNERDVSQSFMTMALILVWPLWGGWMHRIVNGVTSDVGVPFTYFPDSKVHGANMGPTWVLSAPDGPHVGPMNFAIRVITLGHALVDHKVKSKYGLCIDIGRVSEPVWMGLIASYMCPYYCINLQYNLYNVCTALLCFVWAALVLSGCDLYFLNIFFWLLHLYTLYKSGDCRSCRWPHWHLGNFMIAHVPLKQSWIWAKSTN